VTAWNQHYEELYESESDGTVLLEDALSRILNSFQSSNQTFMQIRHVWMALTLAVVVEPTIKSYQPNNPIPEETINKLTQWLLKTITGLFYPQEKINREIDNILNDTSVDINHLSSDTKISSFQVLSEALDVYISAVNTLEPSHSLQALLDILDDCLEGYAIFPGSYGRRELFNWWLLDIVPSCWYLLPPTSVYSLNELADDDSHQTLSQLEETSSLMWSLIEAAIQNQNRIEEDLLSFCKVLTCPP
jgi:transcription termination factor NusB